MIRKAYITGVLSYKLLFLILINDFQNYFSLNILNFADDTILYKIFTKNIHLYDKKKFNTELSKV